MSKSSDLQPRSSEPDTPTCEWCCDSGLVEDYIRPDDDDTPKPCEHCKQGGVRVAIEFLFARAAMRGGDYCNTVNDAAAYLLYEFTNADPSTTVNRWAEEIRAEVIAEVVTALRDKAANWSSRSGEMARERGGSHRNHENERAARLYFAADFIEGEFGGQDAALATKRE